MRTMAKIRRGDIYFVVGGAAVGSEQDADRPAIIVSNDTGNQYSPVVEAVYLTTQKKNRLPTHVRVDSAERPSMALCEQIFTLSKSRLIRFIGRATTEEMRRIDKALAISIGIQKEAGEKCMRISITTPFGEMKFDLPTVKTTALIRTALQYAAESESLETPVSPSQMSDKIRLQNHYERFYEEDSGMSIEAQGEHEGYKGFLIVECEHCGKTRGFCAKQPVSSYVCECGQRTELHGLKTAHLQCKCGSHYIYRTNISEMRFDFPCLNCGNPVDLELNRRGDTYITIEK